MSAESQPAESQPAESRDHPERPAGLPALAGEAEQPGLALDQLSAALAGMLQSGDNPYAAVPRDEPVSETLAEEDNEDAPRAVACEITPRSILEAMLFVGNPQNQPLSSRQVASLMRGVRSTEIDDAVRDLNADYLRRNCPYAIAEEAQGYRLVLREEFGRLREKFHGRTRQARLSQAAIEVLAAVAYNEPVTGDEVARLRGAASGHVLAQLVRRQLLRVDRSQSKPRRTMYYTTERFLDLFGLESLADLPRSGELQ